MLYNKRLHENIYQEEPIPTRKHHQPVLQSRYYTYYKLQESELKDFHNNKYLPQGVVSSINRLTDAITRFHLLLFPMEKIHTPSIYHVIFS